MQEYLENRPKKCGYFEYTFLSNKKHLYFFFWWFSGYFCKEIILEWTVWIAPEVRSCESEIAQQTLYLYLLEIFFKQYKFTSVLFFARVIYYNPSTSSICKIEKNNRISLKKYASKLRAGAILDSHGCT